MPGPRGARIPPLVASAGFGASLFVAAAHAHPSPAEAIAISYRAEGTCPREEQFVASARRYTTRFSRVDARHDVRRFEVRLDPKGADYAGTLVVTAPDGAASAREIVGPDCAAVARALAVIVALAIDPDANVAEPAPEEAPAPEDAPAEAAIEPAPEAAPPDAAPAPEEARALPASDLPQPAPAPGADERADGPPPAPSPRDPLRLSFALEARAELTSAVVFGALPVVGAALETRAHLGRTLPSWLSPSLAVGVRQSLPRELRAGAGVSAFSWTAATIRLCPLRLSALASRLEVAPCAEIDVGVLEATARRIPDAKRTSNAWFDRGASLRASYQLSPSWGVGAGLLVTAPVTRNRFALASGELVSQAPAVGTTFGVFLELRL